MAYALRPIELFNLVAVHGHAYLLHDDLYDYETGTATQPEIEVVDPEQFPFPDLESVKHDLGRLVDMACVQYFTEDRVFELLLAFDKKDILERLQEKVNYNGAISYKAYEIAAQVVGRLAEQWVLMQWTTRRDGDLIMIAPAMAKCLPENKGFGLVTEALKQVDERQLADQSMCLLHFESPRTLDFIEQIKARISAVSGNWGTLAAASQFSWARAQSWLNGGRPLSLIALDALVYCTTSSHQPNQPLWFRRHPPRLIDSPAPKEIIEVIHEHLAIDRVPRTKQAAAMIERNLNHLS